MKHTKSTERQRLKLTLTASGMAILGILLVFLSVWVRSETPTPAATATAPAPASAPATAPAPGSATAPAPGSTSPDRRQPIDPKTATARNMSGMLLLFGLMSFTVTGTCILLIILDIRRSRPAWKTQTRYPRRR